MVVGFGDDLVRIEVIGQGGEREPRLCDVTEQEEGGRRMLALPSRCIDALWRQYEDQGWDRLAAGDEWEEQALVCSLAVGKPLAAANVRRAFRQALKDVDGVDAAEWTPRELRHSFVSLLSDRGVPLEEISRLVGHSGTAVTEEVYRKQIRPVIQTGAVVMDGIFGADPRKP